MTITPPFLAAFPLVAAQGPAVTVLLIAAPAGVAGKVSGEVVNVDKTGQVIIATPKGEVIIKTDAQLQVGQTVDLKLPQRIAGTSTVHNAVLQTTSAPPPRGSVSDVAPPLPPSLLLDIAEETQAGPAPRVAGVLPGYTASQSLSPAQTLLQLIGQSLPATILPQTPEEAVLATGTPGAKPMPMTGVERMQILFIGSMEDAQQMMQSHLAQMGAKPGTPGMQQGMQQQAAPQAPLLAQMIGLTPQKLPIFETMALPPGIKPGALLGSAPHIDIPKGAHIVVHAPVLMTNAEAASPQKPIAAMIATLPMPKPLPEALFALESLPQQAPLLTQLLRDPGSILPPAFAAQMQQLVARPGTPRFAMSMTMALLGLSMPDPANAMFGAKMMQALKAEQRAQLQKELQALPNILREGGQQNIEGGMRFNLPVEMAGQLYLWQLQVRHHGDEGRGRSGGAPVDTPTRFILDLYMSRLGPMQVDGLSFPKSKRLDVIMRSKEAFQPHVREAIRADAFSIFERANLAGSIEFQTY